MRHFPPTLASSTLAIALTRLLDSLFSGIAANPLIFAASATLFAALIAGHVAVALKHAFVDRERIFARNWQYGGPAEQVAEPGSYTATQACSSASSTSCTGPRHCVSACSTLTVQPRHSWPWPRPNSFNSLNGHCNTRTGPGSDMKTVIYPVIAIPISS